MLLCSDITLVIATDISKSTPLFKYYQCNSVICVIHRVYSIHVYTNDKTNVFMLFVNQTSNFMYMEYYWRAILYFLYCSIIATVVKMRTFILLTLLSIARAKSASGDLHTTDSVINCKG